MTIEALWGIPFLIPDSYCPTCDRAVNLIEELDDDGYLLNVRCQECGKDMLRLIIPNKIMPSEGENKK